jgi:uncharacterized RDD family membrane protein YckC
VTAAGLSGPAATSASDPTIASIGRRLCAYGLDLGFLLLAAVVVMFVALIATMFYGDATGKPLNLDETPGAPDWTESAEFDAIALKIGLPLGIVVAWLYLIALPWLTGGTPGKLILGLRILHENGAKLRFWQAHGRELVRILGWFGLGLPYLLAFGDERRRTLHDRAARTVVVLARMPEIVETPLSPPVVEVGSGGLRYRKLGDPS